MVVIRKVELTKETMNLEVTWHETEFFFNTAQCYFLNHDANKMLFLVRRLVLIALRLSKE